MVRRLSPSDFDQMVQMRERGRSYAVIARKLGCSIGTVSWHCLRLGAEPPKPRALKPLADGPQSVSRGDHTVRRFTAEDDAKLLEMEAQGASVSAIAKALDRRHNSITGRLMTLARHQARTEAGR
ncbi:hypothetical protein CSW59_06710 [Caulobacter sp. BP25]|nr:hypothetical protein CSW59_06710 [Caulobacter sp. BP25]